MRGIGRRNQLATIQKGTATADGQGGESVAYSTRGFAWVLVEPLSGREATAAAQLTAILSTGVTLLFRDDLSVTDRLVIGDRTLQIQSLEDPTARREELRALCSEVTA